MCRIYCFAFWIPWPKNIGMAANLFICKYFLKSSVFVKLRSFMIEQHAPLLSLFLIRGRTHFLPFPFSLICSWLSNKLPSAIINNPISLWLSMSAIVKKQPCFLHKIWFLFWITFISNFFSILMIIHKH